uniref:Testicular acid phosphatase homolog n=1 Tax=Parastrongyloides trichosuri TaxID=131310 RepID=A0A0N4Z0H7_PARTI
MPLNFFYFPNEPILNGSNIMYNPGQLTNNGIRMEYELGKKLALKYNSLVSTNFTTEENLCAVAGVNKRCVESLLALMSGMFQPNENELWNESFNWKPIPLKTDEIYDQPGTGIWNSCPYFTNKLINTKEYKELEKHFEDEIRLFSNLTSINIKNLYDLDKVIDNLETRYYLGGLLQIPLWADNNEMRSKVNKLHSDIQSSLSKLFYKDIGGWHHQNIIKAIRNLITNKTVERINLYGVHDTNILLLSQIYDIPLLNSTLLSYASYIAFEVHYIDKEYYIKAEYEDGTIPSQNNSLLKFNNCEEYCLLSKFISLTPFKSTEEWNIQCKGHNKLTESYIIYGTFSTILNFVLLLTLLFAILISFHYKELYKAVIVNETTPLIIKTT